MATDGLLTGALLEFLLERRRHILEFLRVATIFIWNYITRCRP